MNDASERELLNLVIELGPKAIQTWLDNNIVYQDLGSFGTVCIIKNRFLPPNSGYFYGPINIPDNEPIRST